VNEDIIEMVARVIAGSMGSSVFESRHAIEAQNSFRTAARALADAGLLVGESDPACGPGKCELGRCHGFPEPCGGCCGCLGGCIATYDESVWPAECNCMGAGVHASDCPVSLGPVPLSAPDPTELKSMDEHAAQQSADRERRQRQFAAFEWRGLVEYDDDE
jgi:hypothetical protein